MPTAADNGSRCWVCASVSTPFRPSTIRREVDARSVRITDSDYGQTAALSSCTSCGFVFADPLPHPQVLELYRDMDDEPYQDSSVPRRAQMRKILDLVSAHVPNARTLLDVGAGTGLLVSEARIRGLQAHGIEPSRWCVQTAASANGVDLICGTLPERRDQLGSYDVVTLVDVVEHTPDPLVMMREAASRLSAGGVLVIVTPDIGSPTARLMGRRWWHHRVAHICYFSRRSMRRALEEAHLSLVGERTAAWRFPASYIFERLVRYVPLPPLGAILRRLARSPRMAGYEIDVNLRDSRAFIAAAKS